MSFSKKELRKEFLMRRQGLSKEVFTELNLNIFARVFDFFSFEEINAVHVFLPISKYNEINTYLLVDRLQKEYPQVTIVVPKSDMETCEMTHYIYNEKTLLLENVWGIPEPANGAQFPESAIDLVFVPLVVFDKNGHRIGYGKGFYDRFLERCHKDALKIGLSLEGPVSLIPGTHEKDFQMDYCVTPTEIFSFKKHLSKHLLKY